MRRVNDHYEEEYVYLADLTENAALVSWGKFFFNDEKILVPDKRLRLFDDRRTSIGENCEPYGPVDVEVRDAAGTLINTKRVDNDTFTWIEGLKPDTEYTYRIVADPAGARRVWADGPLHNYELEPRGLFLTKREYACRFRTFPSLGVSVPLTFAVLGDTGTGTDDQQKLADRLEKEIEKRGVRLVLMTGDTIYRSSGGSGDDDDEWLLTYFQPYRTIIDHIPFYPCMGNHDSGEAFPYESIQGDWSALFDNLLISPRFGKARPPLPDRTSYVDKGNLFYRFQYGSDIEFICLDTSKHSIVSRYRMFEKEGGKAWMRNALASRPGSPKWRIPFSHHPPYSAGPHHRDTEHMSDQIIEHGVEHGVRVFFSGHEHNFQCIDSNNKDPMIRCIVTGGGGKWSTDKPDRLKKTAGWVRAWGGNEGTHFLIVTISGSKMKIEPIGADGNPVKLVDYFGEGVSPPIEVTL